MNCQIHTDQPATGFCRVCGKPLCQSCVRPAGGTIYCEEHVPAQVPVPATPPPPGPGDVSPGLAFVLGLIPGVGAVYNRQYVKGLIHIVILGTLISIASSGAAAGFEPLVGLLIAGWFFYMAFEAYHTASMRRRGEIVDEFSSLLPSKRESGGFPVGPILLIALGVIFLLNTMEILRLDQILRWWPVFLIALGAYLLYCRLACKPARPPAEKEAHDEQ